jgi:putative DNA primase/helicase
VRGRNGLADGIDIKSDGGYFVAPPSRHASGQTYEWEASSEPDDVPLAPFPAWLAKLIGQPGGNGDHGEAPASQAIPQGRRNDSLTSLAGLMRRRGMSQEAIEAALLTENEKHCRPPLDEVEVARIAKSVARYEPAPTPSAEPSQTAAEIHNSDLGNARRLVARHGLDLRYVAPWKSWHIWDGVRWKKDEVGEIVQRAKETANRLYLDASGGTDRKERTELAKFAIRSENAMRLRAMVELAQTEPSIPLLPSAFDTDPWLLNVENGTIDLRNGELCSHARSNLITKLAPVRFDPVAECPLWTGFLRRIMAGHSEVVRFLQRAVGYSLTGSTQEQVLFLLYGTGANGKSTFLEVIRAILGEYARQTDFTTFLERRNETIRNDVARLAGSRFVTAVETERSRRLSEPFVKQATGSDTITARYLFQEPFEFVPAFKVWLATNHKPEVRGTDEGIWRRIRLVPFTVSIPPEEQDKELKEKLLAEAPGILRWAVTGCLEWQRCGLPTPSEVIAATSDYRAESDVLSGFIEDSCVVASNAEATAGQLYHAYCGWAKRAGEEQKSQRWLGRELSERGFAKDRRGPHGQIRYRGVGLKTAVES